MSAEHICNAVIQSASLDIDRGFLCGWLTLDYGGSSQAFGGYVLYMPKDFAHHNRAASYAGHFIHRCLIVAGVERWDQLKGKTIRVKQDRPYGKILAIGHIVKNDWFDPKADFKEDAL